MSSEGKLKHLEFIQSIIDRMSGNSFLLKGWTVTLVAALFALAASETDKRYVILAYVPVVAFWLLDAYFVSQERLFRNLYDEVRKKQEDQIDFSMDTSPFRGGRNKWTACFFSHTLIPFYLSTIAIMVAISIITR